MSVGVGDKAPDFGLSAIGGSLSGLKELKGKSVVLYFYPKDMTSGCTLEAQEFRDLKPAFDKASAVVVGVSKDSIKRHYNFKTKYNLSFTPSQTPTACSARTTASWLRRSSTATSTWA